MNTPAQKPRVLLVDDDVELVAMLRDYLENDGFSVDCRYNGAAGVVAVEQGPCDIVVLDVMMPVLDGFATLAQIRSTANVPVLMLTARGDDADRIAGLEYGADDYVPKPCSPRELAARLRAILKRQDRGNDPGSTHLTAGDLVLWPSERRAEDAGVAIELTSTEFGLLEVLAKNVGRPVSKEQLSEEAIGRPLARFDRNIDVHIHRIRSKLKPCADGRSRIQTVVRKGYQLLPN